jgi:hypothetical protein
MVITGRSIGLITLLWSSIDDAGIISRSLLELLSLLLLSLGELLLFLLLLLVELLLFLLLLLLLLWLGLLLLLLLRWSLWPQLEWSQLWG